MSDQPIDLDSYVNLVWHIARRWEQRQAVFTAEELVSIGWLALVAAGKRFNPDRGLPFLAYAHFRINGAVRDALRQWRHTRYNGVSCEQPKHCDLDAANGVADERATNAITVGLDHNELFAVAERVLTSMQYRVIVLLYRDDLKAREVAQQLSCTEANISNVRRRAIARLRAAFCEGPLLRPLARAA